MAENKEYFSKEVENGSIQISRLRFGEQSRL